MTGVTSFVPELHYEMVSSWWRAHGWPEIPLSHLPKTGFVATSDGAPAAAGWLYKTDSAFCLFEWIIANPEIRHEKRAAALDALISRAKEEAKNFSFQTIFISVRSEPLLARLKRHGFSADDAGMTNLIFNLPGGQ